MPTDKKTDEAVDDAAPEQGQDALGYVESLFHLDPRSILVVRMLCAVMIFVDVYWRVGPLNNFLELKAFYGPNGLYPREQIMSSLPAKAFVPHFGIDSMEGYLLLFVLELVAAGCMFVGYNTRFSSFLVWFLLSSSQRRTYPQSSSGDSQFRNCIMWLMLIPQSPCTMDEGTFTLAHFNQLRREKQKRITSWATCGFAFQLGTMYFFSTALKSYTAYVRNADTVKMVLQLEGFTSFYPLSEWMWQNASHSLLRFLSRTSFFFELFGGLSIMFPLFPILTKSSTEYCRCVVHGLFLLLQLGFFTFLELGHFQFIMWILHIGCLPTMAWEFILGPPAAAPLAAGGKPRPKIAVVPRSVLTELIAIFLIALMIVSNLNSMRKPGEDSMITNPYAGKMLGTFPKQIEQLLGYRQCWNMFPFRVTHKVTAGRHRAIGTLANGDKIDLFTGRPYDPKRHWAPPSREDSLLQFSHSRWRSAWSYIWDNNKKKETDQASTWLCYKYNVLGVGRVAQQRLASVVLYRLEYLVHRMKKLPKGAPTKFDAESEAVANVTCPTQRGARGGKVLKG